jgi:hypothetical protein
LSQKQEMKPIATLTRTYSMVVIGAFIVGLSACTHEQTAGQSSEGHRDVAAKIIVCPSPLYRWLEWPPCITENDGSPAPAG